MSCAVASAWASYTAWVRTNPQLVSDSESVLKWCSYLLSGAQCPVPSTPPPNPPRPAGYVRNSAVLAELLFSAANLVTFIHDTILAGQSLQLQTLQHG